MSFSTLGYRARGMAFLLVLWVIVMLSVLLGSFAVLARTESLQSRHLFDTAQMRYAAEAGLDLAVYELHKPDILQRWTGDGRPYTFTFSGTEVEVQVTDESGKIDINQVDGPILQALFTGAGVDLVKAEELADAIQDWRDPDILMRLHGAEEQEYQAAGLPYTPKNGLFDTVSELQQVLGMDYALYQKIEPAITVYSGQNMPNAAYAPLQALMAFPGMTEELAQELIRQRQILTPGLLQQAGDAASSGALTLPDGTPLIASGGGLTYSIKSRAKSPNGAIIVLDATFRLGGANSSGRPYVVLRWRDGETS